MEPDDSSALQRQPLAQRKEEIRFALGALLSQEIGNLFPSEEDRFLHSSARPLSIDFRYRVFGDAGDGVMS